MKRINQIGFVLIMLLGLAALAHASPYPNKQADPEAQSVAIYFGEYEKGGNDLGEPKAIARAQSPQIAKGSFSLATMRAGGTKPVSKNNASIPESQEHTAYLDGPKLGDVVMWALIRPSFAIGMAGVLLKIFGLISSGTAIGLIGLGVSLFMLGWLIMMAFRGISDE